METNTDGRVPLANSDLWRTSLERIRERFLEASGSHGPLACIITESKESGPSQERESFLDEDALESDHDPVRPHWSSPETKAFDAGLSLHDPVRPHWSSPETKAFDVGLYLIWRSEEGLHYRVYRIYSCPDDAGLESVSEPYFPIAADAGRCIRGLPYDVSNFLWSNWIPNEPFFEEVTCSQEKTYWLSALFELAWREIPGTSLHADKLVYAGPDRCKNIPLCAWQTLSNGAKLVDANNPPDHWYSVLDDLYTASVAAVDILLELGKQLESGETQNPSELERVDQNLTPGKERRGKKHDTDEKADRRIFEAWDSGRYKEHKDLDKELRKKEGTTSLALDRHRKRSPSGKLRS
jgi:hypothetical protein